MQHLLLEVLVVRGVSSEGIACNVEQKEVLKLCETPKLVLAKDLVVLQVEFLEPPQIAFF